jgi:hypothetical protein
MTNNTEVTNLPLADIKVVPVCQARAAGLDTTIVDEYAEAMKGKGCDRFPPVVVFHDGTDYWLSDGFHRHAAAKKAEITTLKARIHQGTQRDAILHSVGANASHGLRRSNADKRRAVSILLKDDEWSTWGNREIARRCGVDEWLVRKIREEQGSPSVSAGKPQTARTVVRNGAPYSMKTDNIGKRDGLDEVLSVEPDRDAQPDQTWLVRPDTGTTKEDTADDERGPVSDPASGTEEVQLQELLSAWARSSEEVQQQFLASIGVSIAPQVEAGSGLAETEHTQEPEPSHEPAPPQEASQAAEPSQGPEPSIEPGPHATELLVSELVEMWNGYRGHTKTYGRNWVVAGCPDGALPGEHFTFTEKLEPFRAAVSAAPPEIREQFLELTLTA